MKTLTFNVREYCIGWKIDETGYVYKTASHALGAIKRRSKKECGPNDIVATTVHWHVTSRVGRSVVEALTGHAAWKQTDLKTGAMK